jgi:hypothetical protein
MPDTPQHIGWYEISKDIVIPLLGVVSTIVIGVVIAVLLKRKEEKAKVKSLLIDNYMLYLNKKVNFFSHELDSFTYQVYKDIYINYNDFFEPHANSHFPKEKISKRRDDLKAKLRDNDQEASNWSPFTFRFAFLLGKTKYMKEAQRLEDNIINNYMSDRPRNEFVDKLKKLIKEDKQISDGVNSSNALKMEDSLDRLEHLIVTSYNDFQYKIFVPYDNKIADLIDQY